MIEDTPQAAPRQKEDWPMEPKGLRPQHPPQPKVPHEIVRRPPRRPKSLRRPFNKWLWSKRMSTSDFRKAVVDYCSKRRPQDPPDPHEVTISTWRGGRHSISTLWAWVITEIFPDCPI